MNIIVNKLFNGICHSPGSQRVLLVCVCCLPMYAQAEFDLNFIPNNPGASFDPCQVQQGLGCVGGSGSQTPFLSETVGDSQLPEIVIDPDSGASYYHLIVGDLTEGFIQEVYVQRGFGSYQGQQLSASGGATNVPGNAIDPLGITAVDSGNGDSNPRRVIMRQLVTDDEMTSEFLKDKYDLKPVMTQTINALDINTSVTIDLSNSDYFDLSTPGTMSNTMVLLGPDAPAGQAQFDMGSDVQDSHINAGQYTYTSGSGRGGSGGTYDYVDGGSFDMTNTPWETFFNPDTSGPWAYTTNRPN